jgi:WS/DGAT/MGAT family acyltransferase
MSAFDAFLYRGDDDPRTRAQVAAAYVLEGPVVRARFFGTFDRASRVIPRLRQHVVAPPVPVFLPSWVVDPDFDLSRHLRILRAPARGTLQDLLDVVQVEVARPLDASRPLWEAILVERLEGGRSAVIIKMSHAVTDGIGAVRLFAELFDKSARTGHGPLPPEPIPEDVTPGELQRQAALRAPWAAARTAAGLARDLVGVSDRILREPARAASQVREYLQSLGRIFGTVAPPSPALSGRSLARRCLVLDVPLAQLKRAGKVVGASVNDAYLAAVVDALRRYHEALGVPVETLPLAVPVNLRHEDDPAAGNFFGAALLAAPIGISDARERLAAVHERMLAGRAEPAIAAPSLVAPVMARLPDKLLKAAADGTPRPDVQASNIPAFPFAVYLCGRRVRAGYAFGPVPGVAAMVTMQSLAGVCYIGVNLDPAAITDPELFAHCLEEGFRETLRLGNKSPRVSRPVVGRGLQEQAG